MPKLHTICISLAVCLLAAAQASAAPQAQPGDVGLRHDIQVLADYGAISGPITTWPLSWDALLMDLERVESDGVVLPNAVLPTFERVLSRARWETRRGAHGLRARVAAAEAPLQIRSFSNTPRERGEIGAGYSWLGDHLSIDLNVAYVDDPSDGEEVRADGSQIGVDLGNWSIAASTMERWWGPGWDGSLILSNNARPIPAVTIGRNRTQAFESKWLSWIGPWDMNLIFGQLESERAVPDAQFLGLRISFRPLRSLEIGISRTATWCGEGRPCDLDTLGKIFIGQDNLGDDGATFENEPSNQLAGFDVRWTNFWFGTPVSLYGQMIGEDEAGGFPSAYLGQFGVEGSGITRGQTSYRWFAEVAGTSCDIVKNTVRYGCGYRHSIYRSGYTYRGKIIGHGLDNDALVTSLGVVVVGSEGNSWQVLGRVGDVNRVGPEATHTVALVPEELASIDIQHSRSTRFGQFDIGLGYERREDMATSVTTGDARGFLRWTSR